MSIDTRKYTEITNQYGFPQLVDEDGSPICCQCGCHVMPNCGQGQMCGKCSYEFDRECETDYDDFAFPGSHPPSPYPSVEEQRAAAVAGLSIQRVEADRWHSGKAYLVRGAGRRAVLVRLRPFHCKPQMIDGEWLASIAARRAVQRGWKVIVVSSDDLDDGVAVTYNWSQWHRKYDNGYGGEYLIYLKG